MAITRPTYATREAVKTALDVKLTARIDAQVDRAIEAASDAIDGGTDRIGGLLKRRFYPEQRTMTFDWPNQQYARSWRLWLDQHELISATTITSGGATIPAADYFLRPDDGPPFTHLEVDLDSNSAFSSGDTHQRSISITGTFGFSADTAAGGQLAEALDGSETGVDVTDSASIGVGDLVLVDSERMLVVDKAMLDTGVNIDAGDSLTASKSDVSITMSTATGAPVVGETILIDSERMLVVDAAGLVLTVQRAYDGTVLATHAGGVDIYAPRTLTVVRGSVGSTATTHSSAAAISRQVYPGLVRSLATAYAINNVLQETAGYARVAGSGDNQREFTGRGIRQLENDAYTAYGRKARIRGV